MEIEVLQKDKIKRVPKLRFGEFEGEWKTKILQDITKINQGLQIAISERYTVPIEGGSFYITNEFLRVGSNKIFYIKNAPESVKCVEDDLLMTRTGNTGQVVTGVTGAFHNNFFKIKYYDGCSKWYLYYFLTSHRTQHTILKLAGASTIPDLNHGDFYKIKINIPQFSEQQKIASFLSAVDKKIQQLTRKKELLETYKKGVMQKLFSQEIRFKPALSGAEGDEDGNDFPDWENKRLGEVGNFKNGLNKDKKDFGFGSPFVNLMDVFGKHELNNQPFDLVNSNEKEKALYNLERGDILFIRSSVKRTGVGETVVINEDLPYTVYSGFLIRFREKTTLLNQKFKKYCFATYNFRKEILSIATSSANTNINQESLIKISLSIPSLEEQQKIAEFLSVIDDKIKTVTTEIDKTTSFKKGLLQQMFV